MSANLPGGVDHPSWLTVAGTFLGYAAILVLLTVVLFVIPFLVFLAF